jgi:hypothetical protein
MLTNSAKVALGMIAAAVYVALASWAKLSYVDPTPNGSLVIPLYRPFVHEGGLAWRVTTALPNNWEVCCGAETAVIYEDDWPLVERDSDWQDISTRGWGRFLIEGRLIIFSSSNGSNPNHNDHRYWLVVP